MHKKPKTPLTVNRKSGRLLVSRAGLAAISLISFLAGCEAPKPGAAEIEPYLVEQLGQCPLWTVSDVTKLDGIADGDAYRVDFAAKMNLKWSSEESIKRVGTDQAYFACHYFLPHLMNLVLPRRPELLRQYEVHGAGILVKSEQGWRLLRQLELEFSPVLVQAEDDTQTASESQANARPDKENTSAPEHSARPAETAQSLEPSAPVPGIDACYEHVNPHDELQCLESVGESIQSSVRSAIDAGQLSRYRTEVENACATVEDELVEMGVGSGTVIGKAILSCKAKAWAAVREKLPG